MTNNDISTYPGGWFGESWGAPSCDPRTHKPTPENTPCTDCDKLINPEDQGMVIPSTDGLTYWHLDCFLGMVGVPKHLA